MIEAPTVSVVIPAYNAAWCVRRAIDSVLAQDFQGVETIVVNDGSTDDTRSVLASFGTRIRVVDKPNGGMSSARNAGIAASNGRYIAFLDADDRWLPNKLLRQVELLEHRPELAFCAATALLEDPEGRAVGIWSGSDQHSATVADIFCGHASVAGGASAVVARTALVKELGGFDPALAGAEDTDMWIRLAARGGFMCLEEPLVVILKHPASVSRNRTAMRRGALAMTRKNRRLLPQDQQGVFWRSVYAGLLCDYAKWAWRDGQHLQAIKDLLLALIASPTQRGRLAASLLLAMLTRQEI